MIVEKYTVNYEMIEGQTVLSSSDVIYQDVYSADMCAKLCSNYQGFDYDCKSFDYCDYLSTCYLGKTHYYDVPKADIQMTPSCTHYSSKLMCCSMCHVYKYHQYLPYLLINCYGIQKNDQTQCRASNILYLMFCFNTFPKRR